MSAMYLQRVGRWRRSTTWTRRLPISMLKRSTLRCGRARNSSSSPSSDMSSSVEGCTVSPRKSRRKSACFSSIATRTPARANRSPSIIPAGPPPTTQHCLSGGELTRAHRSVPDRPLAEFFAHDQLQPGPELGDGAHLYVDEADRQSEVADGLFSNGRGHLGGLFWP